LLNWRQVAAAAFAVGAVAASCPGVASATPDDGTAAATTSDSKADTPSEQTDSESQTDTPEENSDVDESESPADVPEAEEDDEADTEAEEPQPGAEDETESVDVADDSYATTPAQQSAEADDGSYATPRNRRPDQEPEETTEPESATVDTPTETAAPQPSEQPTEQAPEAETDTNVVAAVTSIATAPTETPAATRPVSTATIVTDVLTWIGLGSVADDLPIPALPVPRLLERLWVAVRQTQYSWNNQRPTAAPTLLTQSHDGVIRGALNAIDYDDAQLTYTVATPARFGTVVVNADGTFAYTPRPGIAVTTDTFTITVDDGPRVHGLAELLGWTGPTTAAITVNVVSPAIDDTTATRPGAVTVQMDTDGRISVIDGTFTESRVYNSADAAALLNTFAPVLGARSGFATIDSITVQRVAAAGVTEEFYRLRQSIDGIAVIGGDVVLVTDGRGTVTGLFNYHDSRLSDVDTTPDITDGSAAAALAAAHLATSMGVRPGPAAVTRVLESTTANAELVILALDDDAAPSLVWRVELRSGNEDEPAVGATYYIRANGDRAGEVITGTSNVQALAATVLARDLSGLERPLNVETAKWWFVFDSHALVDSTRNITTYATAYSFFGLGGPSTPGNVVVRSLLFGWNAAGVSAHANMAVVYDYYLTVLGRDSYDGDGASVVSSVGYNPRTDLWQYLGGYANAFWDPGAQQFAFGNTGGFEAALDVVAHEFSHGVVSHVVSDGGSVWDYGEAGALNEAYADIFGSLVEADTGAGRWLIGEDSGTGALRSMANPTAVGTGYKAHYALRYTGTEDDGGEHWNSTIFSHAAYLMMTDSDTAEVSSDTWAKVFYNSLFRLSPGAEFVDGRAAILDSAAEFGFTADELEAVEDAFDAVGIVGSSRPTGPEALVLL
jgi:Zn-dependent metalloprotease